MSLFESLDSQSGFVSRAAVAGTHVVVFDTKENASAAVAACVATLVRAKPDAVLGLATGSTPIPLYENLVRLHKEQGLSFAHIKTYNLDEYYPIARESEQSYHYFMHHHLFDHIDIAPDATHIPSGDVAPDQLDQLCEEYEREIQQLGGVDLQVLGIGRDGHIGFNEPGSGKHTPTRLVHLHGQTIADAAGDFGGEDKVPKTAITMGVGTILHAKHVVLLAWGSKKAPIVKRAIEDEISDAVPASFLREHASSIFVLDREAAAELAL